jgi:predicted permease
VHIVLDTLGPLVLLIALGAWLARLQFLGPGFMADLNKLAFWIALPSLIFRAAAHATEPGAQTWRLLSVLLAATVCAAVLGWIVARALGVPSSARGTLVQSTFRGNLAYIGIPVVAASFAVAPLGDVSQALATSAIAMTVTMASFNVLAVLVLQASRSSSSRLDVRTLVLPLLSNPLLAAGLSGLLVAALNLPLPAFLDATLDLLGGAGVPIALLCIGGSLATAHLRGRRRWIVAAALLKVGAVPVIAMGLARLAALSPAEQRIALVFAATPTAAAAYVMARQMDGDEALASGSIALSTVLAPVSLGLALWMTR